jgi:putative oxidoreductase
MRYKRNANADAALFAVRLALAAIFIMEGITKLTHGAGTSSFFMKVGFPGYMAYVVGILELLGGLAMLTGIMTTLAGIFFMILMAVVILKIQWSKGFLGFGFEFSLFMSALAIVLGGSGKYTVFCLGEKKREKMMQ